MTVRGGKSCQADIPCIINKLEGANISMWKIFFRFGGINPHKDRLLYVRQPDQSGGGRQISHVKQEALKTTGMTQQQ
ncbi:hypothetical protein [Thiohalophilus sp.]|uniref:hypothetical protein n=1 Tax=Thiohalophilus sp. TaxID=3028392 RepID=UPI002ACE6526|nr:hypothetical protein [Thiohalophilus sp.]MDZ7803835.1 hypothetical protein [Thiohalophilus sp.]